MHDLDRTQMELEQVEFGEQAEFGEQEAWPGELGAWQPLDEVEEMEFASQLLELQDEAELEQFLAGLLSRAAAAAGQFLRSDAGRALTEQLKGVAKKALPIAGRALGQWAAPGIGGDVGGRLGSQVGALLGLELEGLSGEDREFEVARQFVRLAGAAAEEASLAPPGAAANAAARAAMAAAARRYAPGLLQGELDGEGEQGRGRRQARTGRWVRRGRTIVLNDV
jgi:hypothetical protein